MSHVLFLQADSQHAALAAQSVHCIVTSPPYWGLRSYGHYAMQTLWGTPTHFPPPRRHPERHWLRLRWRAAERGEVTCPQGCCWIGALGQESQHDCLRWARAEAPCHRCYLCHLRTVMGECWRVLRNDGTLWVNIGDSYASGEIGRHDGYNPTRANGSTTHKPFGPRQQRKVTTGLPPKNLCGIPQRLALALQADGWYWRSEIIWEKPSCMPENVTDRPTRSHEQVLLFSKQTQYFWDRDAVRKPMGHPGIRHTVYGQEGRGILGRGHGGLLTQRGDPVVGRNCRTVWSLPSEPFSGAHFATFPTALVHTCVLAGTSEHGVCSACGAPWRRDVERQRLLDGQPFHAEAFSRPDEPYRPKPNGIGHARYRTRTHERGWSPTCACDAPRAAAVVFDPFVGSGTTVHVACALGRDGIGTDLSAPYLRDIAQPRIAPTYAQPGLFDPRSNGHGQVLPSAQPSLFGEEIQ
jgi:DNA modification methylase